MEAVLDIIGWVSGGSWEETNIFTYCIKFVVKVQKSNPKIHCKKLSQAMIRAPI